jgi:hypothetical protein
MTSLFCQDADHGLVTERTGPAASKLVTVVAVPLGRVCVLLKPLPTPSKYSLAESFKPLVTLFWRVTMSGDNA